MECEKIVKMLDRYIRKELDDVAEKEVNAHLAACQTCAEELKAQEAMHRLLEMHLEVKAPPDFGSIVMEQIGKIHRKPERPPVFYLGWGRSLVAAGILMIVINMAGVSRNLNYEGMLYKTSAIQKNIIFSMDEVNRNISRAFNNINVKIWRD